MAIKLDSFIKLMEGATTNELQACRQIIEDKLKRSFRQGDTVQFDAGYRGIITGKITKINPKRIKVKATAGMNWNVSPELLTKV